MFFRFLFFLLISGLAWAQDGPGSNKKFVVVETQVQRTGQPVSSKNPQERRWYISNIVAPPEEIPSYSIKKKADEYFEAQVVAPLKRQGVELKYYDNNVELNDGAVYGMNNDQEVETCRQKAIEDHKAQGGNIFFFNWNFDLAAPTEVKLYYRDKSQPLYEVKKKP